MSENKTVYVNYGSGLGLLFNVATAMIGYHIHNSGFWAVMDFFFSVFAWIKWMVLQQVNMEIIKSTFSFFFN